MKRFSAAPSREPATTQRRPGAYDGSWQVDLAANQHCPFQTRSFPIRIDGGAIRAPHPDPGRVDEHGNFEFTTLARGSDAVTVKYAGKLAGNSGQGNWNVITGGQCAGTASMKKEAVSTRQ